MLNLSTFAPRNIPALAVTVMVTAFAASCGGGGGGGEGDGNSGVSGSGEAWKVSANVVSDSCDERISPVTQEFRVSGSGDSLRIDTSVTSVAGVDTGNGFSFGYQEQNGDCLRTYSGEFSGTDSASANVVLTSKTDCGSFQCESRWEGTATSSRAEESSYGADISAGAVDGANLLEPKVSGERCIPATKDLFYRPSAFECNGNALVGMVTPRFRAAFSVVLRFNGFRNDRDPANPECGTSRCSPFKTQKIIELPEHQVRCLGANGNNATMRMARRISIKFIPVLTEAEKEDTFKFEQYCLDDTRQSLN